MAANTGVHRVRFKNETRETTVTFVVETSTGPQVAFTLRPQGSHFEEVHSQTHQTLRLVVGENSNGHPTNVCISSDELAGLDEVRVTTPTRNPGNNSVGNSVNNFVLKKTPRTTKEGPSVTRPWWRPRFRNNEGAPKRTLDV